MLVVAKVKSVENANIVFHRFLLVAMLAAARGVRLRTLHAYCVEGGVLGRRVRELLPRRGYQPLLC